MPSKVVLSRVATLFIVGSTLQELAVQLLQCWVQMCPDSEWDLKDLQEALSQCGWLKLLPVGWGCEVEGEAPYPTTSCTLQSPRPLNL